MVVTDNAVVANEPVKQELREYFCCMCPSKQKSYNLPKGWFIVRRNKDDGDDIPRTIGLYDTVECIAVDILSKELRITPEHARVIMVANRTRR